MSQEALSIPRNIAAAALAVLVCACRNEANSVDFVQESPPAVRASAAAFPDGDRPNRMAKQVFLTASASQAAPVPQSDLVPVKTVKKGSAIKSEPQLAPVRQTKTKLVELQSAPLPYHGRRGHRTTLIHIPRGFDLRRPAIMMVFLHGHGSILQRDVIERQRVPEQVSEAGVNAVLVAPQLGANAADSNAGKLWEPGGFQRFLDEASAELAKIHGDPRSRAMFDAMPIVIVAYSAGYSTAASCIRRGGAGPRVRGIVLLDALYGDVDTFASWISSRQGAFFLSAYATTGARNAELEKILKGRNVAFNTKLQGQLRGGSVTFISAPTEHWNFVTHAWTDHPIKDLLQRLRSEAR